MLKIILNTRTSQELVRKVMFGAAIVQAATGVDLAVCLGGRDDMAYVFE